MIKQPTTILVVGTGSIGQRHARLLAEREDVELWLCDSSQTCLDEAQKNADSARNFLDYKQALAAGPVAVFVCTPHHLHRPMAVAALEAGCHVFCEKPLAENVVDATAIVAAAESNGKVLQVGYLMRLHPVLDRLRKMIDTGELGTLVGGRSMVGTYFTLMASRNRFETPQPNSLILDYTHQPDFLSVLFGRVTRVSAETANLSDLPLMQDPSVVAMTLRYESGALVQIHLDYVQYPNRHLLEIFGDRKSVFVDFDAGEIRSYGHGDEKHHVERFELHRDQLMRAEIENFLQAVHNDQPVACSGADGVAVLQIVEAALQSARELRSVKIDA